MTERTLIARIRSDESDGGTLIVTSPVVGLAHDIAKPGIYLNPLDRVLTIKVLGQRHTVRLPRDAAGRVTRVFIADALTPVEWNEPLLILDPRTLAGAGGSDAGSTAAGIGPSAPDTILVKAPSEGIFYTRPSPDSPPYVQVGTRIAIGTVLGLVEVMKCFNQIIYGGPGLPEKGEIVETLAGDASEVQFGQSLFRVRAVE